MGERQRGGDWKKAKMEWPPIKHTSNLNMTRLKDTDLFTVLFLSHNFSFNFTFYSSTCHFSYLLLIDVKIIFSYLLLIDSFMRI